MSDMLPLPAHLPVTPPTSLRAKHSLAHSTSQPSGGTIEQHVEGSLAQQEHETKPFARSSTSPWPMSSKENTPTKKDQSSTVLSQSPRAQLSSPRLASPRTAAGRGADSPLQSLINDLRRIEDELQQLREGELARYENTLMKAETLAQEITKLTPGSTPPKTPLSGKSLARSSSIGSGDGKLNGSPHLRKLSVGDFNSLASPPSSLQLKNQTLLDKSPMRIDMNSLNVKTSAVQLQRWFRGLRIRRRFRDIVVDYRSSEHSKRTRDRNSVIKEIYDFEKRYVSSLNSVVNTFLVQFRTATEQAVISQEDLNTIFMNVESIRNIHLVILKKLNKYFHEFPAPALPFGKIFVDMAPYLKEYTQYINNYHHAEEVIMKLSSKPAFLSLLKRCEDAQDPTFKNEPLVSHIIKPVQQIPRYQMLLERCLKYTEKEHSDYDHLREALEMLVGVANFLNKRKGDQDNFAKMVEIKSSFTDEIKNLIEPHRRFIMEGPLAVGETTSGTRSLFFFLFNDCIIAAKPAGKLSWLKDMIPIAGPVIDAVDSPDPRATLPGMRRFECEEVIGLDGATMVELPSGDAQQLANAFRLCYDEYAYTFSAPTPEDKECWMHALSGIMIELKKKRETYEQRSRALQDQ